METALASREPAALALEATYELATPAFLAGADRNRPEVRLPSLKGALRFWWRALQARHVQSLQALRAREDMLFGSAELGQSCVSMRLLSPLELRSEQRLGQGTLVAQMFPRAQSGRGEPRVHGLLYLGYGVIDTVSRTLSRACLQAPLEVRIRLTWRPFRGKDIDDASRHTRDEARAELCQALQALGLLGGIGARSRRGFGSLVLRRLANEGGSTWQAPASPETLRDAIASLYASNSRAPAAARLPEWTALSPRARHLVLVPRRPNGPASALALLESLGREMVRFRSFGRDGKILDGEPARPYSRADHDLYKAALRGRLPDRHPERVVFGLPHNYDKKFHVVPEGFDRRASPLLIHVHMCGTTPVLVLSFLPSRFLPAGSTLRVGDARGIRLAENRALWQPIHLFLDRLKQPDRWGALGIENVLEVPHVP